MLVLYFVIFYLETVKIVYELKKFAGFLYSATTLQDFHNIFNQ